MNDAKWRGIRAALVAGEAAADVARRFGVRHSALQQVIEALAAEQAKPARKRRRPRE